MTAKKALITGASGQDGAYLAKLLLEKGYEVTGAIRRSSQSETTRLEAFGIDHKMNYVFCDLAEANNLSRIIRGTSFDEVYNLAAQSFVGSSWDLPVYTSDVNGLGVTRLLESIRTFSPETRFYQASTSEMYGKACETPQNEMTPFHPRSPYGVAKVYGHFITVNYRESFGIHATSGILFNHESPLRSPAFVTRKITRALAGYARGSGKPVELGNLDAMRDWGFAGDFVEGMWRMLQQEVGSDYVLATGHSTSIRDFVNLTAQALDIDIEWIGEGQSERAIERGTGNTVVQINKNFYRPAEVDYLIGDASKARKILGWNPEVDVQALAEMMAKADFDALAAS